MADQMENPLAHPLRGAGGGRPAGIGPGRGAPLGCFYMDSEKMAGRSRSRGLQSGKPRPDAARRPGARHSAAGGANDDPGQRSGTSPQAGGFPAVDGSDRPAPDRSGLPYTPSPSALALPERKEARHKVRRRVGEGMWKNSAGGARAPPLLSNSSQGGHAALDKRAGETARDRQRRRGGPASGARGARGANPPPDTGNRKIRRRLAFPALEAVGGRPFRQKNRPRSGSATEGASQCHSDSQGTERNSQPSFAAQDLVCCRR